MEIKWIKENAWKVGIAVLTTLATGIATVFVPPLQRAMLWLLCWLVEPVAVWRIVLLGAVGIAALFAFFYWREKLLQKPKHFDDNDIVGILRAWLGHRDSNLNTQVIEYAKVDRELRLPRGSTKRLIEKAANYWNYVADTKGENTIRFEQRRH